MDEKSEGKCSAKLQWKRFAVLSMCYFPCYTAFRGLRDLQSTLNDTKGMGLASLSVLNGCSAVVGLLAPAVIRLKLGTKWSIVLGMVLFALYTASNYYPNANLLLSAAVLPGIGSALLWVSRGTYITTVSMELAAAHGRDPAADTALLNSIFFSVTHMSTVCGNMISSLVFHEGLKFSVHEKRHNHSVELGSCGIKACGGDSMGNASALVAPDQATRNLLISIYLGCGVFAVVIALAFLERVSAKVNSAIDGKETVSSTTSELRRGMKSAFYLMRRPRMIMLIPALCFQGVDAAFATGHFTKYFVGCTQGIESVGFVSMSSFITCAVCSPLIGRLIKYTGRVPVFIGGGALYLLLLVLMLLWDPENGRLWHLFAMASGVGFSRAAISTVTMTLLGLLFSEQQEAAFGNLCFWQSVGFAAVSSLGIPQSICAVHVISITMGVLLLVIILNSLLEFRIKSDSPSSVRGTVQYVAAKSEECDGDMNGGSFTEEAVDMSHS